MLYEADRKGIYKSLNQVMLGGHDPLENFPTTLRQCFDFATAGDLIDNHIVDESLFDQILVALKPGGIAVMSAQFSYLGDFWWCETLERLEKEGRIKVLQSEQHFKYDKLTTGAIGKFSKTPVKVLAFEKREQDSVKQAQLFKRHSSFAVSDLTV
jgi:hypothetical protein